MLAVAPQVCCHFLLTEGEYKMIGLFVPDSVFYLVKIWWMESFFDSVFFTFSFPESLFRCFIFLISFDRKHFSANIISARFIFSIEIENESMEKRWNRPPNNTFFCTLLLLIFPLNRTIWPKSEVATRINQSTNQPTNRTELNNACMEASSVWKAAIQR